MGYNEWEEWAPGLKSIEEAVTIRHKILYAFEIAERIADPVERPRVAQIRHRWRGANRRGTGWRDYRDRPANPQERLPFYAPGRRGIILLDGAPRVLTSFPADLTEKAMRSLAELGGEVKCGSMVQGVDRDGLIIESCGRTDSIAAKTVI